MWVESEKYLWDNQGEIILPSYLSDNDVANKFHDFFTKKTATIRDTIINNGSSMSDTFVMSVDVKFEGQHLTHCKPANQDEVHVVIMKSPSNSCELDPLPTNLLKKVLECLLPWITAIINQSLVESHVPAYFRKAHFRPMVKPNLDKEVLENYWPVSSFPFIWQAI